MVTHFAKKTPLPSKIQEGKTTKVVLMNADIL